MHAPQDDAPDDDALDVLRDIAVDLATGLTTRTRYERLLASVLKVVPCDAAAILRLQPEGLVALATRGLAAAVSNRAFPPQEHPRLARILASDQPVRFGMDSKTPDPYDGLVADHTGAPVDVDLSVHACMGCSLRLDGEVVGALTLDSLTPGAFDDLDDRLLTALGALTAASLRTAALIDRLEAHASQREALARDLISDARQRGGGELIGHSPVMQVLRDEIHTAARSDVPVLITGETGVGKELVARELHAASRRAEAPLVYVNCAALPESLAESELFGHTRGAFTGAEADRSGKFELADGGTLFLDEVGELPLPLQAALLRALQFGEIQRVGADRTFVVDVRVLAATNRDLRKEVLEGRFRADLYHRLRVFPILVAPLRLRTQDIAELTHAFLRRTRARLGLSDLTLSEAALSALQSYDWPGNVRELEHAILRAAMRASQDNRAAPTILPSHLDLIPGTSAPAPSVESPAEPTLGLPLPEAVAEFQRHRIRAAVEICDGNWSQAARLLQIDRSNLHRLAKRLGLR